MSREGNEGMDCRVGCGACCIAPSINRPFYGMPEGKPAGVRCVHLDDAYCCVLFNDVRRPLVCSEFQAEHSLCKDSREAALLAISKLELITTRNKK